jgi:hypothetical protein
MAVSAMSSTACALIIAALTISSAAAQATGNLAFLSPIVELEHLAKPGGCRIRSPWNASLEVMNSCMRYSARSVQYHSSRHRCRFCYDKCRARERAAAPPPLAAGPR